MAFARGRAEPEGAERGDPVTEVDRHHESVARLDGTSAHVGRDREESGVGGARVVRVEKCPLRALVL